MPNADVESDPLFPLLTDALRAGPGSPEWHQAVAKLRADGLGDGDDLKLLVSVREALASGRDYRSIRAGPGFTRKVMDAVEQERLKPGGKKPSSLPLASLIATASVIVVLGVLAYLGYQFIWKGGSSSSTVQDLAEAYFPKADLDSRFDAAIPKDWRVIGNLKLEVAKTGGLRPADALGISTPTSQPDTTGGAVVAPITLPADEWFALEVKLKPGKSDNVIVQAFVSSEGDFSPDKSTSSKEVAWLLQAGRQKVVLGGETDSRVLFDAAGPDVSAGAKAEPIVIRLNINREFAVVFDNGQKLWSGQNALAGKPRYVGVRFLKIDASKPLGDTPVVQSIRVLKK